jgi:uncharacterized membrane protein
MGGYAAAPVRFFLTGVATLLPLVITVFVVSWTVRMADAYIGPSSPFGMFLVRLYGPANKYIGYTSGYLSVILLITILGFYVNRATVSRIRRFVGSILAGIPLVGKVYTTVSQIVELFSGNSPTGFTKFGGVGYVKIGGIKMLGLLTSADPLVIEKGKKHLLVFIPNAPFPASGFNILVPAEDFVAMGVQIEDLAKVLMSLGLLGSQVLSGPLAALIVEEMKAKEVKVEEVKRDEQSP